jgi:flagellar motor protein MotB
MAYLKKILLALCLLLSASFSEASGVVSERVYFLEEDGRHALVYTTNRSEYDNYNMLFRNREGYTLKDYIKNFLYIHPDEYTWDTVSQKGYTILKMSGKNFAGLERVELGSGLHVTADGVYNFNNNRNKVKTPDGHYGLWNSPDNFKKITYSWVFPANLEPVQYRSNRHGKWVQRHNTITYYGSDVNNLEFEIEYRPSTHETYDTLRDNLANENDVKVEQVPTGVKITLAATVLYPSGIADLTDNGKSVLAKLAETLKDRGDVNIIVEGHTDNVPISKKLTSTFATNWELASARSINIVHYLVEKGIAESRFESRAFSYHRPIASNDTEKGKTKNRRIELLIEENGLE